MFLHARSALASVRFRRQTSILSGRLTETDRRFRLHRPRTCVVRRTIVFILGRPGVGEEAKLLFAPNM